MRSGFETYRNGEEAGCPRVPGEGPERIRVGLEMARIHPQQITDPHGLQIVTRLRGRHVGEVIDQGIVEGEQSLFDSQADGGGGEALAQREEPMRAVGVIRRPPAFGYDPAVAQNHDAVQGVDGVLGGIQESEYGAGGDTLGFGCAALQGRRGDSGTPGDQKEQQGDTDTAHDGAPLQDGNIIGYEWARLRTMSNEAFNPGQSAGGRRPDRHQVKGRYREGEKPPSKKMATLRVPVAPSGSGTSDNRA